MELLSNFICKGNIKFIFSLKIFTFILLIWVYNPQNDIFIPGKSLQKGHYSDETLYVTFNRLLAKNEMQRKLYHDRTKQYITYDIGNKIAKHNTYTKTAYANLKKREFDVLDSYMKNYKSRHSKKKGLAKLDCYFEKKVFDKIEYMNELAKNMQKDKKYLKKVIIQEHSILIFYTLLPLLGLIYPVLLGKIFGYGPLLGLCDKTTGHSQQCNKSHMTQTEYDSAFFTNTVISLSIIIITICVIIYIFIKIIKYEKLKAGKGKMNFKEYCRFCKGLFYNKKN
ncbi:Plasmodium exported protein, unknown function [Plasmodium vivax]|uniref:Variable surface protein n=1 Tax=Plasmodium vivax TaxID=5855 RepID=A0A565A4Z0_PLAVI|nr:Plasmodium exported protein, unknown function [Plasmodium vivax]